MAAGAACRAGFLSLARSSVNQDRRDVARSWPELSRTPCQKLRPTVRNPAFSRVTSCAFTQSGPPPNSTVRTGYGAEDQGICTVERLVHLLGARDRRCAAR